MWNTFIYAICHPFILFGELSVHVALFSTVDCIRMMIFGSLKDSIKKTLEKAHYGVGQNIYNVYNHPTAHI